jgi:AraC family transcriptional activator FtrA
VESFRVAFRNVVGVPPSVYRERFGRTRASGLAQ